MAMASTLVFLWMLFTTTLIYFLKTKPKRDPLNARLPPGPTPLPIIGSLFKLIGDNPHHSLANLAKSYGPVMTLKLGSITTIIISSSHMAKEVLRKNDQAFSGRSVPDAARALHHHDASIAWLPANQQWRDLRKICSTQLFTTQRLDANQVLRQQKVRELIAHVKEHCADRRAVNVGRAAFTAALNMVSNTVFSVDLVHHKSDSSQEFKDLVRALMQSWATLNLSDFFPVLGVIDPQGTRHRAGAYLRKIHGIFDELIDRRLKASCSTTRRDFLDALLQCLDRHAIKCLLVDLFLAGGDTSSNTVEWAMAELLRSPSSMAKARAEIVAAIKSGKEVEESDIGGLGYLQAVVKETLRLHPSGPFFLPHRAETSVELCEYNIPKHTRVLVNIWAIGRDESVWTDPDLFMPERFLGKEEELAGRNTGLNPFGAGRRICPAFPLAFRMVHLTLASLLHSFDWELPDGMEPKDVDMTEKFGVSLAKAVPLCAVPVPIT